MYAHVSRRRRFGAAAGLLALAVLAGACDDDATGVRGTPGAAGLRDPYFQKLGNGGYDVRHYDLTLAYDPASGRLDGSAAITARATQDLSAFNLDLAGLTVTGARVNGATAAQNRAGDELTIRPHDDLREGDEFTVDITYSGVPEPVTDADGSKEGWLRTDGGAVAVGEPTGSMTWFPGNHHPSDKATYDIRLTVPAGLEALSNGVRSELRTDPDGRVTSVWHTAEPMASYLATVAIGRYDTASATGPGSLPVLTAAEPSVAKASAALRGEIPEILSRQVKRFGPYPFSAAGATVTEDGTLGYALETQTRPVFPAASFDRTTLVHELAHQWFGNSVTPETWKDLWLNEGFATYAEWLYTEEYEDVPAQSHFDRAYAQDANWAFPPADPPAAENLFDPPVYQRGAMVLHQLRETVGDEAFDEILQGWPAKYRHANASTEDFTAYAESVAGADLKEELDELWKVWLYGDGKPAKP
ncbi:M1 family metallopeptidase [Streptomyces sp. NPDC056144]|uniref:M1 family metallopeptidase n=1 Tax=unclassified Streptomyces TaxID=2593676 RepID=UPI0035DA820A